jgi:hypothetical protein
MFYPNPVRSKLIIEESFDLPTTIQVTDFSGNVVIKKFLKGTETEIDLDALAPGTYLIKVSNAKGQRFERIIKE